MFYLNQFFVSIKRAKISGFLFLIITALFLTVSFNKDRISHAISDAQTESSNPYFNALISKDINLGSISRKINSLPGVKRVKHRKIVDAKKELGSLNKELKSSVLERLKSVKYSSLTIELSRNLKTKSQNLVREYLVRLVGSKSLTLSNIKYPKQKEEVETIKDRFLKRGGEIVFLVFALLWIVSFISLVKKSSSYFYLVEKFQRKSNIKAKSLAFGIGLVSVMSLLANLYSNDHFSTLPLLICILIFALSVAIAFKTKYKGPVV